MCISIWPLLGGKEKLRGAGRLGTQFPFPQGGYLTRVAAQKKKMFSCDKV